MEELLSQSSKNVFDVFQFYKEHGFLKSFRNRGAPNRFPVKWYMVNG